MWESMQEAMKAVGDGGIICIRLQRLALLVGVIISMVVT